MKLKVAIAQYAPDYLNLSGCMKIAQELISQAASQQCELLVFGETWLSGYPVWLDYSPQAALWDHEATKEIFALTHQNSITVPGEEVSALQALAKEHQLAICMGINEKVVGQAGHGTLYNAIITINKQGQLVNHHRKLMPTFTEKLVYGLGDGRGLKSVDMGAWYLGGLVCWEHWMPLSRQALHNQGEQVHIALWPQVHEMHQVASRHYAFEGRCFVLAAGQITKAAQLPDALPLVPPWDEDPESFVLKGGSCIIDPRGNFLVEPLFEQEALIVETLDLSRITEEQMTLDVSGHYSRPDVFDFKVKKNDD